VQDTTAHAHYGSNIKVLQTMTSYFVLATLTKTIVKIATTELYILRDHSTL